MKTPKGYDYDLWTTVENGEKKYWVRVKKTGDVSEVSQEIMRFLRSEEKSIRRMKEPSKDRESDLSLDAIYDDDCSDSWLIDAKNVADVVMARLLAEELIQSLPDRQIDVYFSCMIDGMSIREYCRQRHLSFGAAISAVEAIRKKFEKIYYGTRSKDKKLSVVK